MHRNSLTDLSARSMHQAVRMAITGNINDGPMWQELNFGGMASDVGRLVERVQAFGFSSVPLPPIVKKAMAAAGKAGGGGQGKSAGPSVSAQAAGGGSGGGGGGEGGGQGAEPEAAEGIAIFLGGQRNHPVIIAVDDRRHRPMGLKPGENAQYDDAQQMTLMRRNGLYLLSNDNEDGEGKKAERMVSLRHVEKKKQERKTEQRQYTGGQQKQGQKKADDFKHEGETVNTELRVTKKKIEFRNGDEVVAEHDKASKKWDIKGKETKITSSDGTHITSQNVTINGSTGVGINGPTSVNGNPVATTDMLVARDAMIIALEARIAVLEARLSQ